LRVNILSEGKSTTLAEFVLQSVDIEGLYGVYWRARKAAHSGRLPSVLDHETWEEFVEDDPKSATEFIAPIHTFVESLLSLKERGDAFAEMSYDLVETGSWIPRQVVKVVAKPVYREIIPAGRVEKLFSTESEWKKDK